MLYALRSIPTGKGLFPRARPTTGPGRGRLSAAVQAAAVVGGAVLLLYRVAGLPSWNSVYAEDRGIFLVQSLARPWHLLVPYNGYLQFLPRLLAQTFTLLPLTWAAVAFAWAGALIAAASALFTYHASAGYIRSRALRAVLAAALILLPIAPLELADNGVNAPWYLMIALFWAVLWRPESRAGRAVSALIAFVTVMSSPLTAVFAPLLAVRVNALRSWREPGLSLREPQLFLREHWVTIGWLLGWPLQVYAIALSYASHTQRVSSLATLGQGAGFWARTVVLRAFGWHVSWDLVRMLGTTGATLLCGALLLVLLGLAWMSGGRQARILVPLGVVTGFVFAAGAAMITNHMAQQPPYERAVSFEAASRYSSLPLILVDAALIAGVDALAWRHGGRRRALSGLGRGSAPRAAATVTALAVLAAVLVPAWVTDYRYQTQRTSGGPWKPIATRYLRHCDRHPSVVFPEWTGHKGLYHLTVPCSRLIR